MPLEFPASPSNGQVYNNYVFDSAKGVWGTTAPSSLVTRIATLEDQMGDIRNNWGARGGPTGLAAAYRNNFAAGRGGSADINPHYSADYIEILTTGQYEVVAFQRGNGAGSGYISVGLSGSRDALESRTSGLFNHDHNGGASNYSSSRYIGLLNAGELVCAGGLTTTDLLYSASLFTGSLIVRRIG